MQLPKHVNKKRLTTRYCQYPDCGREYYGYLNSKYCDIHRGSFAMSKMRDDWRKKKIVREREFDKQCNIIIEHHCSKATNIIRKCDTCKNDYYIILLPKVFIYSAHCSIHRNEHKRTFYRKNMN